MDQSVSQVSALPFQVAGRGGPSDDRGRQGILLSGQGHALKQVQAPPQGPRERTRDARGDLAIFDTEGEVGRKLYTYRVFQFHGAINL